MKNHESTFIFHTSEQLSQFLQTELAIPQFHLQVNCHCRIIKTFIQEKYSQCLKHHIINSRVLPPHFSLTSFRGSTEEAAIVTWCIQGHAILIYRDIIDKLCGNNANGVINLVPAH